MFHAKCARNVDSNLNVGWRCFSVEASIFRMGCPLPCMHPPRQFAVASYLAVSDDVTSDQFSRSEKFA